MDETILKCIKETIEDDLTIYKNSFFLHEDDFWTDDKLVTHHNEHVDYLNQLFTNKRKTVNGKNRLLMPSFASKDLLDKYRSLKDMDTSSMSDVEYLNHLKELDDLENDIYNDSIDRYNDIANKFMNDTSLGGWKCSSASGKFTPYVYVRVRHSSNPSISFAGYDEYVMFEPVFSRPDEEGNRRLIRRKIISYGLVPKDGVRTLFPSSGAIVDEKLDSSWKLMRVTEALLTEANRQQLLQKSRNAQNYSLKNQAKGKNRYDRRNKSSISATVRDYNMIQMDPLFKRDILEFKIPVMGETDVYVVDVRVDGLLSEIRKQVMSNKGKLEFKVILQSLMKVLNVGNVYIGCNCPDAKYRMAYQQTKNDYKAGYKERRPSDITNPNDTLGAGCKHVLLILANLDWAVKVASVINNYIKYCRENLQLAYAEYIFPKVYGVQYDKAVQMGLFETGLLPDDAETMKAVIDQGMQGKDKSGKFVKGNDMRFQKKELEEPVEEPEGQTHLDLDTPPEETEVVDLVPADEE